MPHVLDQRLLALAQRVRTACLRAAEEACEDAGLEGLCADGRLERARQAIAEVDVERLINEWAATPGVPPRREPG